MLFRHNFFLLTVMQKLHSICVRFCCSCSLNCGKGTLGGEPLILQLECDTCVRRTWELNVNGVTQLVQCTDQEWCGFESVTFAGYPVGSKLKIIAKG